MSVLCVVLYVVVAVTAQYYYTAQSDDYGYYDYEGEYDHYPSDSTRTSLSPLQPSTPAVERNCPPGISQFSEHDVRATIDDIMQCSKISDQVESSIAKYVDMQHVYLDDLESFIKSIEYRPLQLKRILEMVALTREQLEPAVYEFNHVLDKASMYEDKFHTIRAEYNMTMEKLDRYSRLCELRGCSDRPYPIIANSKAYKLHRNGKQYRYICIPVTDLKNYISEKLNNFKDEHNNTVNDEIEEYKSKYEIVIQDVKRGLKDRALAAFGRTMFDILSLQDELYKFNVTMSMDAGLISDQIITNILELQWKMSVLDNKVESYGSRCGTCKKLMFQYGTIQTRSNTKWTGMHLIDELLEEKLDGLKKHVTSEHRHILQELDDKIREAETTEVLEKHVELKAEIEDMIVAEQRALDELIKMAPHNKIVSMEQLLNATQQTLADIDETLENL